MNKYPQVITYSGKEYFGYFNKEKNTIESAMFSRNKTTDDYINEKFLGETFTLIIGGAEYSIRELTQEETVEFDNYKNILGQAKKVALNKLIIREAGE